MPPNFTETLRSLGLSINQPEPNLIDVNSRDIISLNIDHKAKVVAEKKQQAQSNLKFAKKNDKVLKAKVNEN